MRVLPAPPLALTEPLYFLSEQQRIVCLDYPGLSGYADQLPGWVPHRAIAEALGHDSRGIDRAMARVGPYLWATEFENVHRLWHFDEPSITVDGRAWRDSETFYQAQKPYPFDADAWAMRRSEVMRIAVQHKFTEPSLRRLLLSTRPHPLLSIKWDSFWGVTPDGIGQNRLAELLMELRAAL